MLTLLAFVAGSALRICRHTSEYLTNNVDIRTVGVKNSLTGSPFGPSSPIGPWKIKENVTHYNHCQIELHQFSQKKVCVKYIVKVSKYEKNTIR